MAFLDDIATRLTGRTQGQRAFYNATRAGLWNPNTLPEGASGMGGLTAPLGERRQEQANESQRIDDAVFAHSRPVTE